MYGVGTKVAACIALFGLHRLEAFPVDTHIRQALERHYPQGFPEKYRDFQGVLQQYMFTESCFRIRRMADKWENFASISPEAVL